VHTDGECAYIDESSKGGESTQMVSVPKVMSLPRW